MDKDEELAPLTPVATSQAAPSPAPAPLAGAETSKPPEQELAPLPARDDKASTITLRQRWVRLVRTARWRAHWLWPSVVPGPDRRADPEFRVRHDREVNERTRVPDGESLTLTAMWGVEVFGPSEVDRLYEGLVRLGWRNSSSDAPGWIRHQRAFGGAGGWYEVGPVFTRGEKARLAMIDNHAQLPEGVDHLLVRIFQLTSSLTCVLIGFSLKPELARCYEEELNRDRRTVSERGKRRWSISYLDPHHLKTRSIDQTRNRLRGLVSDWFASNLPGYFCGRPPGHVLSAELVTTMNEHLLPRDRDSGHVPFDHWRRVIANVSYLDVWTLAECQGVRVAAWDRHLADEPLHVVATLRRQDVPSKSVELYGGPGPWAILSFCHERLDGVLINLAGLSFLRIASREIKASREALQLKRTSGRNSLQVLEKIQTFFDHSVGIPASAAELRDRSERVALYQHECAHFTAPPWPKAEEPRALATQLREQTGMLAKSVLAEEHALREHLEQLSSILSVRESVTAQRRMEWLTVAALIVAFMSLVVAALTLWMPQSR